MLVLVLAGMAVAPGNAAAAGPAIVLDPTSGTPGSVVRISGSGFCGRPACKPVEVLFSGIPVASGIAVAADGAFRGSFRVPGGGTRGPANVAAVQSREDGYELRAFQSFDVIFGKGEEAEQQAEIRDLVARPSGEPPLRGQPLASFLAAAGVTATPAPNPSLTPSASSSSGSFGAAPTGAGRSGMALSQERFWQALGVAAALGLAAAWAARLVARRHRQRHA